MSKYAAVAELRAVIAALGERTTPPWWRTTLLTDVGLRITSRVFPRSALSAALKSGSDSLIMVDLGG